METFHFCVFTANPKGGQNYSDGVVQATGNFNEDPAHYLDVRKAIGRLVGSQTENGSDFVLVSLTKIS